MESIHTVVIGGGQAGLAMSRCLTERGIGHVVLERGRIGERWRSERWDSARLLTPRWHSRLPHWHYRGADPDGYMSMNEVVRYFEAYARSFDAPVRTRTTVRAVGRDGTGRFRVTTNRGEWLADNVVVATGFCDVPRVPAFNAALASDLHQVVPTKYRNPVQLPPGGVLIVGASATGTQLAEELAAAGRDVTLAVGTHVRLPRRYRGRDILWWMELSGEFMAAALPGDERGSPPPQLIGRDDHRDLDLGTLQRAGVRLIGRAIAAEGSRMRFADDLETTVAAADARLGALLDRLDELAITLDLTDRIGSVTRLPPVRPRPALTALDLRRENIATVVWATGYRRHYPWLEVPVIDEQGDIRHVGGITDEPGLYVLGMRFQRRRNSNFIDGVGNDATELARHLAERLRERAA